MEDRLTSPTSLRGTLWTGRERDACGTGFVAEVDGRVTRRVVDLALDAIERIAHRGAVDADDLDGEPTGDGAGVLLQVPWALLVDELPACRDVVAAGRAAVGMCFLPPAAPDAAAARDAVQRVCEDLGVRVVGWRVVPLDPSALGASARATAPRIEQVVVELPSAMDDAGADALLYRVRRELARIVRAGESAPYVASISTRTIVYKGLVVGTQLRRAFPDLSDPRVESAIAVFHQRYSTNTFPAWERAQPLRTIAHNGEINTVRGNAAWMRARGAELGWPADRGGDDGVEWLVPVIDDDGSDSSMLDDAVQLLVHGGRPLTEAMTMLLPPAWDHDQDVDAAARDALRALSATTEPWDGPAAVAFTDGSVVGACLDRNGLRPARWLRTDDGLVACASETGAVPIDAARITSSGRLGPGQMLVVDTTSGTVRTGDEVLDDIAAAEPWGILVAAQQVDVVDSNVASARDAVADSPLPLTAAHALFGYTREELTAVLRPMVQGGSPPVGSMGDDTPLAVLATQPRSMFSFVRQGFAEVTNPAIDPLRERHTMSLDSIVGPRPRLLDRRASSSVALRVRSPLLTEDGLERLQEAALGHGVEVTTLDVTIDSSGVVDADAIRTRVDELCAAAHDLVRDGTDVIVLSDRQAAPDRAPLPALLVGSSIHQHLVDTARRTHVGLVFETGEVRESHHVSALIGHGIDAVCPWLALATARELATGPRSRLDIDAATAQDRLVRALEAGLRTSMSRMGISTADGYRGAHVFEAVGLHPELGRHLGDTQQRPGSVDAAWVASRVVAQAQHAAEHLAADAAGATPLPSPGFYKFKRDGELHGFEPAVVTALQHALSVDDPLGTGFADARARYRDYARLVRDRPAIDLRDLLEVSPGSARHPVPLDEVEPARELVRRFSTGAMSHGSLGSEAHETLAQAAALIGSWSNSGEGGEDVARFGTDRNSAIKQVASGRFGVTPAYLRSARELQVKIAQGSKPGEGGHLPGHKVTDEIARIRHTQAGVSLISPPPHHDIYSIEDLAQLIHDLACVNPRARSSVKLVSQAGVGTIAAGVAKARADVIVVSGAAGGTGASPLGSIKHAGMPWEWGLAETQQVLVANRLRGRVRLRVDGGMRTGRDVLVAALLGADEFSFGTVALVAEGCKMARTCHNDQCPVGIATQRADLRALFPGRADQVAAYLLLVAEEVRELLAALGARTLDELIGRSDLLRAAAPSGDAATGQVDLDALLARADVPTTWPIRHIGEANEVPGVEDGLDARIALELWPAVLATASGSDAITWSTQISNMDRSVGARLSGEIAERIHHDGIDPDRVHLRFDGVAGQSFGAFAIRGLRLELRGEANDFVGKGLAGATIDVRFPDEGPRASAADTHVLLGNACLYGATSGSLHAAGIAGERFAVRNSGANAVVEGAGDHLCEYMTGGTVVVLGAPGRNVASGMSGGTLWVLDDPARLRERLAPTGTVVTPSDEELRVLLELVKRHAARTGSVRARELLFDWPAARQRLHCIHPTERASAREPVVAARA